VTTDGLSKGEAFLLRWISNEDASLMRTCEGNELDRLLRLELVEPVAECRIPLVRLTEAGRDLVETVTNPRPDNG
jgi:hypothetical protein